MEVNTMTNLARFSPSSEMRGLQREIDRLFDQFFPARSTGETDSTVWAPRTDLIESEDAYVIHLDVPGMAKDELDVNYQDGMLTIAGERKSEQRNENDNVVRIERALGRFYRSFGLPRAVNAAKISASYTDGVLTVRVPKAEESKPRRIKVG
jgi:HSP20 family protein